MLNAWVFDDAALHLNNANLTVNISAAYFFLAFFGFASIQSMISNDKTRNKVIL